jgi:DNA modification methylase
MTGKPTGLMGRLVECAPPGGVVCDPFMGSGTTGVACMKKGRNFIGVEQVPDYFEISKHRIVQAEKEMPLIEVMQAPDLPGLEAEVPS